ncbi:MAG TPA: hypothetical protein VF801_12000 [Rhodocyclaceae bacterium]
MPYTVTVRFGQNNEYEFSVPDEQADSLSREQAADWLHGEYQRLECAPRNPIGKILLLDVILDVAKYGGESHFSAAADWALQFARCCAATLKRDVLVDVPNLVVG